MTIPGDTQSSPPPNDPPNPTTDGGFEQPLPPDADAPEGDDPGEQCSAGCHGTAQLGTQFLSLGMTVRYGAPLTAGESAEFCRDLEAVLAKYDCPDFKYAEEAQLIGTTVGIVATRAAARAAAQAKAAAGEDRTVNDSDSTGHRKEGVGKDGGMPKAGVSSQPTEASVLLAGPARPN